MYPTIITDDKTDGLIGIPETLISSSICGCLFALLSGQPLVIIGNKLKKTFSSGKAALYIGGSRSLVQLAGLV